MCAVITRPAWRSRSEVNVPLAQQQLEPTYEALGIAALSEPWEYALAAACGLVAVAFCAWMYRRDSVELPPGYAWLLLGAAAGGVGRFGAVPGRCSTADGSAGCATFARGGAGRYEFEHGAERPRFVLGGSSRSRGEQVVKELVENRLVERMRDRHDVHVYRFDQEAESRAAGDIR